MSSPQRARSKRMIRNRLNGWYLGADGGWTADYSLARNFPDIRMLLEVARTLNGLELEEVLMVREHPSHYDLVLPLSARSNLGLITAVAGTPPGGDRTVQ